MVSVDWNTRPSVESEGWVPPLATVNSVLVVSPGETVTDRGVTAVNRRSGPPVTVTWKLCVPVIPFGSLAVMVTAVLPGDTAVTVIVSPAAEAVATSGLDEVAE